MQRFNLIACDERGEQSRPIYPTNGDWVRVSTEHEACILVRTGLVRNLAIHVSFRDEPPNEPALFGRTRIPKPEYGVFGRRLYRETRDLFHGGEIPAPQIDLLGDDARLLLTTHTCNILGDKGVAMAPGWWNGDHQRREDGKASERMLHVLMRENTRWVTKLAPHDLDTSYALEVIIRRALEQLGWDLGFEIEDRAVTVHTPGGFFRLNLAMAPEAAAA